MTKTPRRPAPSRAPGAAIAGHATADGTERYAERHASHFATDYFRSFTANRLRVSSIGLGTYLGECSGDDDRGYTETGHLALASCVSLVGTTITLEASLAGPRPSPGPGGRHRPRGTVRFVRMVR